MTDQAEAVDISSAAAKLGELRSALSAIAPRLGSLVERTDVRGLDAAARIRETYRQLAERLRQLGEPLLLYDVASDGLQFWPGDVRLRQLQALALANSGATGRANSLLQALRDEGHLDEETLGMLGRTYKDLWSRATDPEQRAAHLRHAFDTYDDAYRRSGGIWSGINAATLAVMLGDQERARHIAAAIRAHCLTDLVGDGDTAGRYWPLATLAEAALILGDLDEAETRYREVAELGRGRLGDLASTRRNARLLLGAIGGDSGRIERVLRVPAVALFDAAGATARQVGQRFLVGSAGAVRKALGQRLRELNVALGFASAASELEILFHEAILDLGGEAYLVLPYDRDRFVHDYVDQMPGSGWRIRFDRVVEQASGVTMASEQRSGADPQTYEYADLLLHGLAASKARQLDTDLLAITVQGASDETAERWRRDGLDVELVELGGLLSPASPPAAETFEPTVAEPPTNGPPREIVAMLFADAVGFSKLNEEEVPCFVEQFLGAVGQLSDASPYRPVTKNTWGDGLYLVFEGVRDAGLFALDLCDLVRETDWPAKGLPRGLHLRVGLHVGPAYRCTDPLTGRLTYFGVNVSRAARIEPITPPDQVYASEPFAALSAALRVDELRCDYVGRQPQAKQYGTFATYHVRRA
jgi:class 3 adenylate cyclase